MKLVDEPLFRAPHHTASAPAIVGGGVGPRPGEVSLAHRGVLLFDELGEFVRPATESLRQPLEDGTVAVARITGRIVFPARFVLVGTMNVPTKPLKQTVQPHFYRNFLMNGYAVFAHSGAGGSGVADKET
jgi:predicted ATPase with chaperone activity